MKKIFGTVIFLVVYVMVLVHEMIRSILSGGEKIEDLFDIGGKAND